jgi:hypothetical protein
MAGREAIARGEFAAFAEMYSGATADERGDDKQASAPAQNSRHAGFMPASTSSIEKIHGWPGQAGHDESRIVGTLLRGDVGGGTNGLRSKHLALASEEIEA